MRAGAYARGSKPELSRPRLRQRNQLADTAHPPMLAGDEYVGLTGKRSRRDKVLQRLIWEALSQRCGVRMSLCVYQHGVAVSWRRRDQCRARRASDTGVVL